MQDLDASASRTMPGGVVQAASAIKPSSGSGVLPLQLSKQCGLLASKVLMHEQDHRQRTDASSPEPVAPSTAPGWWRWPSPGRVSAP
jgi:hypothetical protein